MYKNYPFPQIKEKLASGQKVLVALPANPSFDHLAAALALQLALEESNKSASVYCPTPMTVEFNRLIGVDKVNDKLQGTDMIISLNYPVDQIEKVSYNDESGRPSVVIQPKVGAPQLSENLASYGFAGVGADLIFTIGVADINQFNNPGLFNGANIVNIDYNTSNPNYGSVNVIDPQTSTYAEMILALISGLNLPLSIDSAQNIIDGVWNGTGGLSGPNTGADTYEAVAICLRAGAVKPIEPVSQPKKEQILQQKPVTYTSPLPREEKSASPRKTQPPSDWLEPKIYRGTSTV